MFHRILLCYDGSVEGRRALRQGADIAIAMKAETFLLAICRTLPHVFVPEGITPYLVDERHAHAQALLDEGVAWLREHGLEAQGELVEGDPLVEIVDRARGIGADLIVVGHRPRSALARWWSSSEEASLLDRVHCSVLAAAASD